MSWRTLQRLTEEMASRQRPGFDSKAGFRGQKQDSSNSGVHPKMLKQARQSGQLNLSSRGLAEGTLWFCFPCAHLLKRWAVFSLSVKDLCETPPRLSSLGWSAGGTEQVHWDTPVRSSELKAFQSLGEGQNERTPALRVPHPPIEEN